MSGELPIHRLVYFLLSNTTRHSFPLSASGSRDWDAEVDSHRVGPFLKYRSFHGPGFSP